MKRNNLLVKSLVLFVAIIGVFAKNTPAERLGADVIGIFPKNIGEIAYADLKSARSQKSLAALELQFLPDELSQIQSLLAANHIDLIHDADSVVWGFIPSSPNLPASESSSSDVVTGEQIVGIALGQYNPESTEFALKQRKVATFTSGAVTLFALQPTTGPNDLFFTFLDSSTLAFGHRAALQQMLDVRAGLAGGVVTNTSFFQLIDEVNGAGALWAVMGSFYSQSGVGQLVPDFGQIAQSSKLLKSVKNLLIKVDADGGMQGELQVVLASPDDANTLGQLLPVVLLYESYQANNKQNRAFADLLGRTQVLPAGERVKVRLSVNEDEVASLPQILSGAGNAGSTKQSSAR